MLQSRSYFALSLSKRGFTFVEMMATLAVTGVLTATAVPNFATAILNQGVKASAFDLVSALGYTRSEAIKRNRPVTLRALGDDWRKVWFVCAPDAAPTADERGRCNSGEMELRDWDHPDRLTISAGSTTGGGAAVASVTFRSDGRINTGVLFNLCDQNASAAVIRRVVRLDPSGRPNLKYEGTCAS